jgi:hypothetical protein
MGRFEINSRKQSPFEVALASSLGESTPFRGVLSASLQGAISAAIRTRLGANARPPSTSYDQLRLFELIAFYVHKGL